MKERRKQLMERKLMKSIKLKTNNAAFNSFFFRGNEAEMMPNFSRSQVLFFSIRVKFKQEMRFEFGGWGNLKLGIVSNSLAEKRKEPKPPS